MPIRMADRPPRFLRLTRVREKARIVTLNSNVDEGGENREDEKKMENLEKIRGFKKFGV